MYHAVWGSMSGASPVSVDTSMSRAEVEGWGASKTSAVLLELGGMGVVGVDVVREGRGGDSRGMDWAMLSFLACRPRLGRFFVGESESSESSEMSSTSIMSIRARGGSSTSSGVSSTGATLDAPVSADERGCAEIPVAAGGISSWTAGRVKWGSR